MTLRRTFAAAALVTVAFVATACDATPTPPPSPSAPASTAPSPSPSPTPTAAASDDPTCLVGSWVLDEEGMGAYYAHVNDLLDGAVEISPEGDAVLEIGEDGSFVWRPDARITSVVAGRSMEVSLTGTLSGTYTAEPGRIRTDAEVDDRLEITGTVDGKPVDASGIAQQIGGVPLADAAFICTTTTLELTTSLVDTEVMTTLERRN